MNDTPTRYARMTCALQVAHVIAVAAYEHIPEEVLEAEKQHKHQWAPSDYELTEANDQLKILADDYVHLVSWRVRRYRECVTDAISRLRQAVMKTTGSGNLCDMANVVIDAWCVATQAADPGELDDDSVRVAGVYVAMAVVDAENAGIDIKTAVCAKLGINPEAWPIFITLLNDGQDILRAVEASEILAHQ